MRRWAAALASMLVIGATAACAAPPAGIDGDLTDDWAAPPKATQFRPASNVCHTDITETAPADEYDPIACTKSHVVETVAVGELTGTDKMTQASDGRGQAFQQCSRQADAFLGADWRIGWLILQPVLPSAAGWKGGARWYRCDLAETSPVDGKLVDRTSSVRGGLKAGSSLRMGCANPTIAGDNVTEMHPVACKTVHSAEFAGLWQTSASSSGSLSTDQVEKGCDAAIAKFTGVPDNADITARTGWLGFPPDDESWSSGDHSIRCFLWLNGEKMTGSYKGVGTAKLPIHYQN